MGNLNSVTNSTTTACYGYCQYRLPCGYCEKMKSMCPYGGYGGQPITITYSSTNGKTMEVSYSDNNSINVINKAEC